MTNKKNDRIGYRLEGRDREKLDRLCQATGLSESFFARKALSDFLDKVDREGFTIQVLSSLKPDAVTTELSAPPTCKMPDWAKTEKEVEHLGVAENDDPPKTFPTKSVTYGPKKKTKLSKK